MHGRRAPSRLVLVEAVDPVLLRLLGGLARRRQRPTGTATTGAVYRRWQGEIELRQPSPDEGRGRLPGRPVALVGGWCFLGTTPWCSYAHRPNGAPCGDDAASTLPWNVGRRLDGWHSTSLVAAQDGTRVVIISQWRDPAAVGAMQGDARMQAYFPRIAALATLDSVVGAVAYARHA